MPEHPLRLPAVAVASTLVLLALIAAFTVSRVRDDNRTVKSTGLELTAGQAHGRELFGQRCAGCHTLGAVNAVGRVGPNLDVLAPYGLDESFVRETIENGVVRGNGTMPADVVTGDDADDVASFLSAVTRDQAAARSAR